MRVFLFYGLSSIFSSILTSHIIDFQLVREKMERDTILLSWNLGPKVNSRNRPKFLRETRLVAY